LGCRGGKEVNYSSLITIKKPGIDPGVFLKRKFIFPPSHPLNKSWSLSHRGRGELKPGFCKKAKLRIPPLFKGRLRGVIEE